MDFFFATQVVFTSFHFKNQGSGVSKPLHATVQIELLTFFSYQSMLKSTNQYDL